MYPKHDQGQISVTGTEFKWRINIDSYLRNNEEVESPKLPITTSNGKKESAYLRLYPKGITRSQKGHMALFLVNDTSSDLKVNLRMSLLNNNRKEVEAKQYTSKTISSGRSLGWSSFISRRYVLDPANELLRDGELTIVCALNEKRSIVQEEGQSINEKLFREQKHSDVTVVARGGQEFRLHKCVLATQSNVFEAMFNADMKEKHENLVEMIDIDYDVLREFFGFLYTGKVEDLRESACDLLFVADRYNVVRLKKLCQRAMSANLSVDNALEYLLFAEMNDAKKLKSSAVRFVVANLESFYHKPEFKQLPRSHLFEIFDLHFNFPPKQD